MTDDKRTDFLLHRAETIGRDIREAESIDTDRAYRRVEHRINTRARQLVVEKLIQYAACLTIPLLLSTAVLAYMQFRKAKEPVRYAEITASRGVVLRYELPDNSVVWLNAGSRLRYPTEFRGGDRQVELTGEGYFEVAADKKHPFYVNTPSGLQVNVCGTKFDVSAYNEDTTVETVLEQGVVNIVIPGEGYLTMKPGEMVSYDKQTRKLVRSEIDTYGKTAWRDGKLIFRNASLDEIFNRLERHFNVDIELSNPRGRKYHYWATFRNETLHQVLDYLSRSTDMTWSQEDDNTKKRTTIHIKLK